MIKIDIKLENKIEEIISLYFSGHSIKESIRIVVDKYCNSDSTESEIIDELIKLKGALKNGEK